MPPVDVLLATDGQDRGARFGLLGSEASIGRGPVMDLVLTDPRVSRRHARLLVDDGRLLVEDLGSTSGTSVNGRAITDATVLAVGDRLRMGDTELTVLWTPGAGPATPPGTTPITVTDAPVPPGAGARPAPASPIEIRAGRPPARRVSRGALLAVAGLVAAVLAVIAIGLPALSDPPDSRSFWNIGVTGLRALALCAGVGAVALAAAWLACEVDPARARGRAPLAAAACAWGGIVAGAPCFVAAANAPGYEAGSGLTAMAAAGAGLAAAGVARLTLLAGPRGGPRRGRPAPEVLLVAAGGLGGLCMAASGPMTWISRNGVGMDGFDASVGAGRWIVPLGLAVLAACVLTALVGSLVDRRTTLPVAGAATALAGAGLTYGVAATVAFEAYVVEAGLTLALTGGALALLAAAGGLFALASRAGTAHAAPAGAAGLK